MQIDQTTLNDLSIFQREEDCSIFHYLNFTETIDGKHYLKQMLSSPLQEINEIIDVQNTIKHFITIQNDLPKIITNGTIMVITRFYDTAMNHYPQPANAVNGFAYKMLSSADFSLTKYSINHFLNFIKGLQQIAILLQPSQSKQIQLWVAKIEMILAKPKLAPLLNEDKKAADLSNQKMLQDAAVLRYHFKQDCFELIAIYSKIDAYLSLAMACQKYHFCFPQFIENDEPFIQLKGLYHLLLATPTSYHLALQKEANFLFLTGANMAGKSTFIKAVGVAVYLAHLGMGVPAQTMELSLFDGLLSNIHIMDNIFKNESYFFNEVQRVKNTIQKISNNQKWLILIDELFKGTNIKDAMKCSTTVIEGLQKRNNAVFIVSTHLYEIGEALTQYSNIQFKFFETTIQNNELVFSYQLKDGISNDRLGYLILEKEGVVDLLKGI